MTKKPWYKEGEMIVALCALVVSVCSLGIMVYETSLARETQKATVWPQLDISFERIDDSFGVVVTNSGIGPAIIKSYKVNYDGEYFSDWASLFKKVNNGNDVSGWVHSYLLTRTISPNQHVKNIYLEKGELASRVFTEGKLQIELCYCSVLNDCWIKRLNDLSNASVSACPAIDKTTFMQ